MYGIEDNVANLYRESLEEHIKNVVTFGSWMGIDQHQLGMHDLSKFSGEEFPHYAMQFHSDEEWKDKFDGAWLHHIQNNKHHWNSWVIVGSGGKVRPVVMPKKYIMEMVADWHGANKTYQNSWDISIWLANNGPEMILHEHTLVILNDILESIGYIKQSTDWVFVAGHKITAWDL